MRAPFKHLPTQLAIPTKSPWVYAVQGANTTVLHPRGRVDSFRAEYVSPASLNFSLPTNGRPELAFVGRSNAGKSTLIGELIGNSKIVRTSKDPGCTKTVNFFALQSDSGLPHSYLVDLPGYGFARKKKQEVRQWAGVVQSYLTGRSSDVLRQAFVLVDSRHGLQRSDVEILSMLDLARVSNSVVLTKVDKVKPSDLLRAVEGVCQSVLIFPASCPVVHCISARKGLGMAELTNTVWHFTQ